MSPVVTYNRRHTLHRLWNSLNRTLESDFEWVIVDNGSTDNTASQISTWKGSAPFDIVYHRLSTNGGKSKGLNIGKTLISGKYVIVIDDDDALFDNALTQIKFYITATKFDSRLEVGNLVFRAVTEDGLLHGELCPMGVVFETTSLQMKYVHTNWRIGERCSVTKASVFKEFDYIELPPPNNDLLEVVNLRKARKFKSIYIDSCPIRIYWINDGLDRMTTRPRHYVSTSIGNYFDNFYRLNEQFDYFFCAPRYFIRSARNMCRAGLHNRKFYRQQYCELSSGDVKLFWLVFGILPGSLKFFLDVLRLRLKLISVSQSVQYRGY